MDRKFARTRSPSSSHDGSRSRSDSGHLSSELDLSRRQYAVTATFSLSNSSQIFLHRSFSKGGLEPGVFSLFSGCPLSGKPGRASAVISLDLGEGRILTRRRLARDREDVVRSPLRFGRCRFTGVVEGERGERGISAKNRCCPLPKPKIYVKRNARAGFGRGRLFSSRTLRSQRSNLRSRSGNVNIIV